VTKPSRSHRTKHNAITGTMPAATVNRRGN
jgi:hypothetical protein